MSNPNPAVQVSISLDLGVNPRLEIEKEAERRVQFLADYLTATGANGYVLGISGGVDSTVAGLLAQEACRRTNTTFTAMRLPYGAQADEDDAQTALAAISPDQVETVDIRPAVDALHAATTPAGGYADRAHADFNKGNIKARMRMTAQYATAGRLGSLVIGTDHAAEAVMGFYTKWGDGAADLLPLSGLVKSQVRALGRHLGAPAHLVEKVPTADLEDERPGLPDEVAHGVTYDEIDAYLLGRDVTDHARNTIERAYAKTAHKREMPPGPPLS